MKLISLNPVNPASVSLLSFLNTHQLIINPGDHTLKDEKKKKGGGGITRKKNILKFTSHLVAQIHESTLRVKNEILKHCYPAQPVVHSFGHLIKLLSNFERTLIVFQSGRSLERETVSVLFNHLPRLQQRSNLACCKVDACRAKKLIKKSPPSIFTVLIN